MAEGGEAAPHHAEGRHTPRDGHVQHGHQRVRQERAVVSGVTREGTKREQCYFFLVVREKREGGGEGQANKGRRGGGSASFVYNAIISACDNSGWW